MIGTASSSQVTRRHPKVTTYRCCLPALAGFVGFCRVGPNLHRHLNRAVPKRAPREKGFDPAVAGCGSAARRRSQGTASSPSSTTGRSVVEMFQNVKDRSWTLEVGNWKTRRHSNFYLPTSNFQTQRRGRDSNPRGSSPTRFPSVRTRPTMRPLHFGNWKLEVGSWIIGLISNFQLLTSSHGGEGGI